MVYAYRSSALLFKRGKIKSDEAKELLKHQAEFRAYQIIATSGTLEGFKDIFEEGYETQFESNQDRELIKEAIKIRTIITTRAFPAFFKMLRTGKVNYMFACLMVVHY